MKSITLTVWPALSELGFSASSAVLRSISVGPLREPKFGRSAACCGVSPVNQRHDALGDVVDDGAAPGEPVTISGFVVTVVDDGRRNRRARPLARFDAVGDRLPPSCGRKENRSARC